MWGFHLFSCLLLGLAVLFIKKVLLSPLGVESLRRRKTWQEKWGAQGKTSSLPSIEIQLAFTGYGDDRKDKMNLGTFWVTEIK